MKPRFSLLFVLLAMYLDLSNAEDQWEDDLEQKRSLLINFLCLKEPKSRFCSGKSSTALTENMENERESQPESQYKQSVEENSSHSFKEVLVSPETSTPKLETTSFWKLTTTSNTPNPINDNNDSGKVNDDGYPQELPKKIRPKPGLPDEVELLTAAALEDAHGAKLSHTGGLKSYDPNALWRNDVDSINYGRTDMDEMRKIPKSYYPSSRSNFRGGSFGGAGVSNGGLLGPFGLGSVGGGAGGGGLVGVTNGVGVSLPLGLGNIGVSGGIGIGR